MRFLTKKLIILLFFIINFLPAITYANEFLYGNFKGKTFKVVKGKKAFTNKNLYSFKSHLTTKKIGKNKVEMKIKATLQMRKDTPVKTQIRRDKFKIKWDDSKSGSLINESSKHKNDKSKFKIDGNILIIRSWIDRNKMYETQVYEYIKP